MLVGSKQDLEILFLKMDLLRCFSVGPSIVEEWVMSNLLALPYLTTSSSLSQWQQTQTLLAAFSVSSLMQAGPCKLIILPHHCYQRIYIHRMISVLHLRKRVLLSPYS